MISYASLNDLEKNCGELLQFTNGMISGANGRSVANSHKKIKIALRKIVIANELMGKGVICVSGLQGAGKTTLIKNFYNIQEDIMNISLGRGERLPVFVSEKEDCKEIELYSVSLDEASGSFEKKYNLLTAAEFRNASLGNDDSQNIMYLEMRVPYKHFKNESYMLLLLPGFEKKNDYWQTLIEFAVNCSDTSIFVFNESSYAKMDNQLLLKRIREKFKGNVIYAISHSDESKDYNESVKAEFLKDLDMADEDRVICVGEYSDDSLNNIWIESLKNALEKYCNSLESVRELCRDYIYSIIEDELRPEIGNIKECIDSDRGDSIYLELQNSNHLDAFDKIVSKRRKQLEKKLDDELGTAYESSRMKLEKIFTDKQYAQKVGVKDKRILKRTIFGENSKDLQFARKRVEESMRDETKGVYHYQTAFVRAVCSISNSIDEHNACKDLLDKTVEDDVSSTDLFALTKTTSSDKARIDKLNLILNDVAVLIAKQQPNTSLYLQNPNFGETMRVIAEMGTQYFCLATIKDARVNSDLEIPEIKMDRINPSFESVNKTLSQVDKVVLGALGITGVDLAGDGVINAIPALADAMGLSVGIIGTAVAAITGAATGVAVIKDVNRLHRTEQVSAENAIRSIQGLVKHRYLDAYDEAMLTIRDRLEDNLILLSGKNQKIYKITNAAIAITKIETQLDTISREVSEKEYNVIRAFKG